MADIADLAQEIIEQQHDRDMKNAGVGTFVLEPGDPGECIDCGYWNDRLIKGRCAPCRDKPRRVH